MNRLNKIFMVLYCVVASFSCAGNGARVGLPAPALSLPRVGGGNIDLATLKGKVTLVNFWATWCDPCRAEMPDLNKLYRQMEGKKFELLSIAVDNDDKAVEDMARKMNLSFPILRDKGEKVARAWGTIAFPESYLIGPDGVIVEKYIGVRDWTGAEITNKINELIK
jgi:cytochrome c biogenesis protein CcmG/thiol:disulfide interchange protein DsbE